MSKPRRILTVRVSEEAGDAIAKHCNNQGITITAWFEAVGMRLADLYATGKEDPNLKAVTDGTAQVARQVDAERRARSNRSK